MKALVLIDDDHGSRNSLAMLLEDLNYQVYQFSQADEALNFLHKTPVPVILSDIRMPFMSGLELLEKINEMQIEEQREYAVILFTGQSNVQDAVRALKTGAFDYLTKPLNVEELINTIDRAFEFTDLKSENKDLKQNFNKKLEEATFSIQSDVSSLKNLLNESYGFHQIGVFSKSLQQVFEHAQILHQNPEIPVLIQGETGTGKELIARLIHFGKDLSPKPFIGLNAATIPHELFESELFGYEGGSFTGSKAKGAKGKIALADDGSIFLDEITSINTHLQAKLLRVIQEKEYYQVGGSKAIKTKARFIFAANDNVSDQVSKDHFRKDLYYRLKSGFIHIPPLRERKDEIIPLAEMFLKQMSQEKQKKFKSIHPTAKKILIDYHWPGNVRELKSTIERVIILYNDHELRDAHLNFLYEDSALYKKEIPELVHYLLQNDHLDIEAFNLMIVQQALDKMSGNKSKTAEYLKISRNQLYTFLEKLNK